MNQPDHTNEALIIAWVNNSLTQEQKAIFSKKYAQDSVFAAAADNASVLAGSASVLLHPQYLIGIKHSYFQQKINRVGFSGKASPHWLVHYLRLPLYWYLRVCPIKIMGSY